MYLPVCFYNKIIFLKMCCIWIPVEFCLALLLPDEVEQEFHIANNADKIMQDKIMFIVMYILM